MNKYQELSDKVEEVKTGKNEAMLVEPLINLAESFREITKRQAEELRDLLAKNYQEHEEYLAKQAAKQEARATELETVLEQIKEGEMVNQSLRIQDYQNLERDDVSFLNDANSLVEGIMLRKKICEKRGKKYSFTEASEQKHWQLFITNNSKNDDQKTKLEKILNYWKSQEKNGPNNPNHEESDGEKFPLVPVIISGSVVLGLIVLLLVFKSKKKRK